MLKKKISNSQSFSKFKPANTSKFFKKNKRLPFLKKYLKNKSYNFRRNIVKSLFKKQDSCYKINILFTSNNFFCTLAKLNNGQILYSASSGNYKIKTSKKLSKHTFKLVLDKFIRIISKKIEKSNLFLKITAPLSLRKKILDIVGSNFNRRNLIIQLAKKKCYNGCRPPKKQRKKRKGLRLLK